MSSPRWLAAIGLLVVGVLAAGCGSSSHPDLQKPAPISAAKDDGQDPAILAAYRDSLADFAEVAHILPINPNNAVLAVHMSGSELAKVKSTLNTLSSNKQFETGQLSSLSAAVDQFNGSEAVVSSCERDTVELHNDGTGSVAPNGGAANTNEKVSVLLTKIDSMWKVTQHNEVSSACIPR